MSDLTLKMYLYIMSELLSCHVLREKDSSWKREISPPSCIYLSVSEGGQESLFLAHKFLPVALLRGWSVLPDRKCCSFLPSPFKHETRFSFLWNCRRKGNVLNVWECSPQHHLLNLSHLLVCNNSSVWVLK